MPMHRCDETRTPTWRDRTTPRITHRQRDGHESFKRVSSTSSCGASGTRVQMRRVQSRGKTESKITSSYCVQCSVCVLFVEATSEAGLVLTTAACRLVPTQILSTPAECCNPKAPFKSVLNVATRQHLSNQCLFADTHS